MTVAEKCYEVYQSGGQYAVETYVLKNYPRIRWAHCAACESEEPALHGACLVCGSIIKEK